jgi:hypothetical protein
MESITLIDRSMSAIAWLRQLTHGDYASQLLPWENQPQRQITSIGLYAAGLMFWFTQKKFVGSYFFLIAARRP